MRAIFLSVALLGASTSAHEQINASDTGQGPFAIVETAVQH
jgi:hypothetical protein